MITGGYVGAEGADKEVEVQQVLTVKNPQKRYPELRKILQRQKWKPKEQTQRMYEMTQKQKMKTNRMLEHK